MEEVTSLNPDVAVCFGCDAVRNEAKHILAVNAVLAQEYEGDIDIWIAIAPSI